MSDIESVLNELDPREKKRGSAAYSVASVNPVLVLLGILVALAAFGAGIAISMMPQASDSRSDNSPSKASTEKLWDLLMREMPTCNLQESTVSLNDAETRTVALYAAARFNCAEVVKTLLNQGVNLDEKRFIKGTIVSVEDYAGQYGAIEVVKLIQDARAQREKELAKMAKQLQQSQKDPAMEVEERRRMSVQTLLAQEAELRKSIHYERARLDCEALRERLGYSADLVHMTDCIKKEIDLRRAEREGLGHSVPK